MALNIDRNKIERPYWTKFWGAKRKVRPKLVNKVFGNGMQLIFITPLMTRPHHYFVLIDSSWDTHPDVFRDEQIDDIYNAIEEQFGYYFDGEGTWGGVIQRGKRKGEYRGWPAFFNEGCSWGTEDPKPYLKSKTRIRHRE